MQLFVFNYSSLMKKYEVLLLPVNSRIIDFSEITIATVGDISFEGIVKLLWNC